MSNFFNLGSKKVLNVNEEEKSLEDHVSTTESDVSMEVMTPNLSKQCFYSNTSFVKRIQLNQKLNFRKEKIKKELESIEKQLEMQQKGCDHIRVCIGWSGPYLCRDTSFCTCLFCREYDPESNYKTINASSFKENLYYHGEMLSYREGRLIELQNLAVNLLNENPEITINELTIIISEMIKQEKNLRENKDLGLAIKLVPNKNK